MDMAAEKERWRQWARQRCAGLGQAEKESGDKAICERVLALRAYREAGVLFCFVGTAEEIDTRRILEQAWRDGKRVAVPKCREEGRMDAFEITSFADLAPGKYGILEPKEGCPPVSPQEVGFAILPCVACDREGWRLGHGGGYYDRYLEQAGFPTVVLCRESLLLEKTPAEGFDSRADWVIMERESIDVRGNGTAMR